ncbi:MAG: hypothetical protein ACYCZN_01340 [Candidatus Dormibacteria bacterium]
MEMSQGYGLSCRAIAGVLERVGVPAPFGGTRWHPSTVSRALAKRGVVLPKGRSLKWRLQPRPEGVTPLHVITAMAWRRRTPGSGSDLCRLLSEQVEPEKPRP